jgi:hypothetical protein
LWLLERERGGIHCKTITGSTFKARYIHSSSSLGGRITTNIMKNKEEIWDKCRIIGDNP